MTDEERYFSGESLHGDDLDSAGIAQWYREEENGYYELAQSQNWGYDHHALDVFHAFRNLPKQHYPVCLAFGCAEGDELVSITDRVGRFIAIEPAEAFWRNTPVGQTPIEYLKPPPGGDIALPSGSVDLAICISALHHVPNVSHVLSEMVRVLRPGGNLVLREPICSMGDWRKPRSGLTPNERGFPTKWLNHKFADLGLQVVSRRFCCFAGTIRVARLFRVYSPYNSKLVVWLDWLVSEALRWSTHYHRDRTWKKIAPSSVSFVLQKM
jgi:SAM-dependent methyltransferase